MRCYSDTEIGHVSYYWNNCDYINPQYQNLPEENDPQTISVYPNPIKDNRVMIEGVEDAEIRVFNSLWQMVKETKDNVFDLSDQKAGMYIIKVITPSETITKQIIKK